MTDESVLGDKWTNRPTFSTPDGHTITQTCVRCGKTR